MLGFFNKKEKEEVKESVVKPVVKHTSKVSEPKKQGFVASTSVQGGRLLTGVVVSDKMQKTRVVAIVHLKMNERYQKQIIKTTRLKAHDEENRYHTGDKVVIQETRPLSREKRWRIIHKA